MSKLNSPCLLLSKIEWSEWNSLEIDSFSEVPKEPGLYRVRHRTENRDHLEYIGESGDTRRRIQSLARGAYADEMPYRDPHTAAPCLWAVQDNVGSALDVSYTTPPKAEDDQHRKGIEAALIALHRREANCSPTANFGRIIDGYKQSSYSQSDPAYRGGPLASGEDEPNSASGVQPPDWQNWREPLARDWMHLEWSEPYRLAERLNADPPDTGVYRIWYEGQDSTLAYIGESSNISSRLYNHEQTFGGDALFAYAERSDLDASHKRKEIETDCIGAYYLEVGKAPLAQFGHTENIPP
ncbi:GIY-YIG nuclease family protein [Natronomonas salsuginis]|uniref:GIY-YIG nuclease family protein n=1 Tax=Natronomonas salsuginis TaxID=2217661 RepID=A0A4V5ZP01_9EURY|nr:GIY-YIG nuclease family protein [Natronomonas salsuginis]TKR25883.1 GIY-YIG nuclease family protein [Natronomonas salsuginis]